MKTAQQYVDEHSSGDTMFPREALVAAIEAYAILTLHELLRVVDMEDGDPRTHLAWLGAQTRVGLSVMGMGTPSTDMPDRPQVTVFKRLHRITAQLERLVKLWESDDRIKARECARMVRDMLAGPIEVPR